MTSFDFAPDGFWGSRLIINRDASLAHCLTWMEKLGWLENFDRVARNEETRTRAGWMFSDSEVYKLLEAMAWQLGVRPDAELEATYQALLDRVEAAQSDDGYISTAFGHPGLPPRYSDLAMGHELYNMGHLLQAATARLRTHGEDRLTAIARRAADHICSEFGHDATNGICGHPEIEVALVEFSRATGNAAYRDQARLFVERRGHGLLPVRALLAADYFQDDVPVRRANVLRGHAVRALYLSAGATDVAVDDGDAMLLDALRKQWQQTVERRTYITGGMGSRHQDEGFGADFELPPDRAYCETCAGVASVMFSWRLYLATGEVHYVDLIERTLFNIIAVSPSSDGRAFFYANPLHQREAGAEASDGVNSRAEGGTRAPWFDVSCCPTNVARTLASLPAYMASADVDGSLAVLHYAPGDLHLAGWTLRVETRYPEEGRVTLTVVTSPEGVSTLRLRVPSWAEGATLAVHTEPTLDVAPGWVDITREHAPGEVIVLTLPVQPRVSSPDPRVDASRASVAIERGPVVLCLESVDLPAGVAIDDVRVTAQAGLVAMEDGALITADVMRWSDRGTKAPAFGRRLDAHLERQAQLPLIPYHRWAERGASTMRIFLPLSAPPPVTVPHLKVSAADAR